MLEHPPTCIIGTALVEGLVSYWADETPPAKLPNPPENADKAWPLWISTLPYDDPNQLNQMALFGPQGRIQGRFMKTGEAQLYPAVQLRTQSRKYDPAWAKAMEVLVFLTEKVRRRLVVIDDRTYTIHNVTAVTDVIEMNIDDETDLHNFAVNFLVRIT